MQEKIRAFICIDFPDEIIKEVSRVQSLIQNKKFIGKLTELENLHLTLKFLGEISQEQLEKVIEQLEKISFQEFQAKLLNIGLLNYRSSPRIVWIKIGSKEIHELQKQIDNTLKDLFPKEERFMSHLTIARIKHVSDKISFQEYVNKIPVKQISFPVNSFKLMSSELKPLGPIYITIKEFNLKTNIFLPS